MKPVVWMGSSLKDLREFPDEVKDEAGFAIYMAQCGDKALNAVPLVGFCGSKVLEVVMNDDGNTYRAVYTVKLKHAVYILHAFQKKSKAGIATPKKDMDLIRSRLNQAIRDDKDLFEDAERKGAQNDQIS